MARRSTSSVPARQSKQTGITPRPVTFRQPPAGSQADDLPEIALPERWRGEDVKASVGGLHPAAEWKNPGESFEGTFIKVLDEVGPNGSRIYQCASLEGEIVSIWGSTVLDDRWDDVQPQRGDLVYIVYRGLAKTKRDKNPAKVFEVYVIPAA